GPRRARPLCPSVRPDGSIEPAYDPPHLMIPFDRRPATGAPPDKNEPASERAPDTEAGPAGSSSRHGTLPPPEMSSASGPTRTTVAPRPLGRRTGARAEEAWLRARVAAARKANEPQAGRS